MSQQPVPPPLTPDQLAELQRAQLRAKKIRRAAAVASTDAWLMALFTAVSLLSIPFDLLTGIPLTLALAWVTWNSFQGAKGLRRFNEAAPNRLAVNQCFLAGAIIAYALWSLRGAFSPDPATTRQYAELTALDPQIGGMLQQWTRTISITLYTSLIAGTLIAQGLTALYYHTRLRLLRDYKSQTPPWVIDLQNAV